ncbi:hypothetical protein BGZ57DRAFT_778185, partial [Hyaloscypha finlandica]
DAYLEEDISNNRLIRAFIYMSIRYNSSAPKEVLNKVIKLLFIVDLDIVNLKR